MTQFVQHYAAKDDADQPEHAQSSRRILRSRFGAPDKNQQKQKSQMNADFDSKKTPDRDGPTSHRHAYPVFYLLRHQMTLRSCEKANRKGWHERNIKLKR